MSRVWEDLMNTQVLFSTGKDDWETPDDFFRNLDDKYHFVLDAAANSSNCKCPAYFGDGGVEQDALEADWQEWLDNGNIWLNPPYSRKLQTAFLRKVVEESGKQKARRSGVGEEHGRIVCLLPARTDTANFHDFILPNGEIEFLRGRIKFKGAKHGAPFPSMICIF